MASVPRRVVAGLAVPALGALTLLTTATSQPASALPADQVARGEAVWNRVCVECHGPDSTNLDAPLLLRPAALKRYPTAAAAVQYVMESMPYEEPGSLPEQDYWDVIAFLLAQEGISLGETPLGPDTAGNVPTVAQ